MSKDIKAGTWWLDEEGDIVYVAAVERGLPFHVDRDEPSVLCYYMRSDGRVDFILHEEYCLIRELPGCTGFDYKEPPVIPTPGDHPTQWVPLMGVDGQVYHCLGYLVPNR